MIEQTDRTNTFLGFLEQNQGVLAELPVLNRELREERAGWMNSPTFKQISQDYTELLYLSELSKVPPHLRQNVSIGDKGVQKLLRRASDYIAHLTFDPKGLEEIEQKYGHRTVARGFNNLDRVIPVTERARWQQWTVDYQEFAEDFWQAIRPYSSALHERKQQLFVELGHFLDQDYDHFRDLATFLVDPRHLPDRERIRAFLVSLAGDGKTIFEQARNTWLGRLRASPPQSVLERFYQGQYDVGDFGIESMERRNKKTVAVVNSEFFEWYRYAKLMVSYLVDKSKTPSEVDEMPDDELQGIFLQIPIDRWPSSLKEAYFGFAAGEIGFLYNQIKTGLGQFQQQEIKRYVSFPSDLEHLKHKRDKKQITREETDIAIETPTDGQNRFQIGILQKPIGESYLIEVLDQPNLMGFAVRQAQRFAFGDERMLTDCQAIIENLTNDPYGLGTKKLPKFPVTVGHKHLPLRSFNPARRPNLNLQHEYSRRIRVLYVIDREEDTTTLGIEGVYRHEEYDKRLPGKS